MKNFDYPYINDSPVDLSGREGAPRECETCEREQRSDCDGEGWLEPIGPHADGSYITSRPCPNN